MQRIREMIGRYAQGALQARDLRTRQAGQTGFVKFHPVVPGEISVAEAHGICDRIEDAIQAGAEGAVVTIHLEPEGKARHSGVPVW